jgi:hypothetical protein
LQHRRGRTSEGALGRTSEEAVLGFEAFRLGFGLAALLGCFAALLCCLAWLLCLVLRLCLAVPFFAPTHRTGTSLMAGLLLMGQGSRCGLRPEGEPSVAILAMFRPPSSIFGLAKLE